MKGKTEYIAQSWCHKNDIIIYGVPVNKTMLKIVVNNKGRIVDGTKVYKIKPTGKDEEWGSKVFELYKYYYNKENK